MQEQGASLVNSAYFASVSERISSARTCAQLQEAADDIMSVLNAEVAAIQAQMALLEPLAALLTAPGASPGAIVSWITGLITAVVEPMYKPYLSYQLLLAARIAQIASVASELAAKAADIPSCSVSTEVPP